MAGLFAKGTAIYKGDGASPENFTPVGNLKTITGPGIQVTTVDTTTHSTDGFWREMAAVLLGGGKVSFGVNFDPADETLAFSTGLYDDMVNLRESNYQLRFPPSDTSNSMLAFKGFVTGHPFTFPVDNVIEASIEITVDGAITPGTFTP